MLRMLLIPIFVLSTGALPVPAQTLEGFVTVDRLPEPSQPVLSQGQDVWGAVCENCHGGNKLVGAPKITDEKAWSKRIAKGLPVLFTHAIEGFYGPTFKEMPARGGADLSDDEVHAAVAFMVSQSGGADVVTAWLAEVSP